MEHLINSLKFVENELEWTESKFRLFRRRQEVEVRAPIHEIYIDGLPLLALIEPSAADDPDRKIPLPWSDCSEESLDQLSQLLGGPLPGDRNGRTGSCTANVEIPAAGA